ncbi:endonuclease III [Candidatus Peregrinibacteria bacterium]|nr:endonuclease III [Candidatus Peregrinibacteria bacterium]
MKKALVGRVIEILKETYPEAKIALKFDNVWQLLVVVILSAQCTDERVNIVSPPLFKRFKSVRDFADCDIGELEKMIYSTGFYKAKARNIRAAAVKIVGEYGGKVPDTMEALLTLTGVARKTANVVLSTAFSQHVGIVVDTHVARLAGLLGWVPKKLSDAKNAVKIEQILMKTVPHRDWGKIAHLLIWHGRKICIARRPKCEICPLNKICPSSRV